LTILVTNDDGIHARGLRALVEALKEVGEVVVVAPDREQSAVGTSVTLHQPLRAKEIKPLVEGVKTYSVEGTPGDCVILGLGYLIEDEVSLVAAGINEGANLGDDVLISGTVAAAFQGHLNGMPSIAISVGALEDIHTEPAARLAALLARRIEAHPILKETLLNINLPNLPLDQIEGIEVTRLGRRSYRDVIQEGHDGKRTYYWIVRGKAQWQYEEGTDVWALSKHRISITPLHADLTNTLPLTSLKDLSKAILQELVQT
jgi:5'-nucleotidase